MNRLQKITATISTLVLLVFVISLVASRAIVPNQPTPIKNLLPTPKSQINIESVPVIATWIWKSPTEIAGDIDPMLDFATEQKINTIYLYIDEYVDIYETADKSLQNTKMATYQTALKKVMSAAKTRGIEVHAMAGNPNYSYDSHEYIPPIIIKHVYDYNQNNPDLPFAGIQFDVEFYDNKKVFLDTKEAVKGYLKLVNDSAKQVTQLNKQYSQNLKLGFAIPFWFDQANDYFGDPILKDVLTPLSSLPESYVVVMSYRNNIDQTMEVSKTELEQAELLGVKIILAQEVAKNSDNKITHFGKSRDEIKVALNEVITASKSNPSFEGISIHDLSAFRSTL